VCAEHGPAVGGEELADEATPRLLVLETGRDMVPEPELVEQAERVVQLRLGRIALAEQSCGSLSTSASLFKPCLA